MDLCRCNALPLTHVECQRRCWEEKKTVSKEQTESEAKEETVVGRVSNDTTSKALLSGEVGRLCYKETVGCHSNERQAKPASCTFTSRILILKVQSMLE